MQEYLAILIISFVITLITTPVVKKIAFTADVLDKPDKNLKIHKQPVPYLGGIAIFLGILISLLTANYWFSFNQTYFWGVVVSIIVITFLGLLDDLIDIKQTYKFIAQVILALGLVFIGYRVEVFPLFLIPALLTVFYVVGACNALNLLDGLDGLAAGITLISSLFFFVLFLENMDTFGIVLSSSLLGACGAFLLYNFNPASIFMGDAGSMLLGLMLSVLMISYTRTPYDFRSFLIPVIICGVPIFDTALTYLRRYLNNRPIFPGDRNHFYDKLIDRGFSTNKTALISYSISICLGILTIIMRQVSESLSFLIFLTILFILGIITWKMKLLEIGR